MRSSALVVLVLASVPTGCAVGDGRIAFVSKRSGDWEVYTMAPDGSDVRNVSDEPGFDHRPTWLDDGARLGFVSARGVAPGQPWRRWDCDRHGRGLSLAQPPVVAAAGDFPQLSTRLGRLVYAAERDGDWQLFTCALDGTDERALLPAPGRDGRPQWSPDGRWVLFESERDGNPELYTVCVDAAGAASRLRRLTDNVGLDRYGAWSPDGTRIAFASDRADGETLELHVLDVATGALRRLTHNDAEDGEPSWSPDGTRLVFRSNASGNPEICVVDVATGQSTNISNDPEYDGEPAWSPR